VCSVPKTKEELTLKGREVYVAGIGSFSPGDPIPFDQIEDVLGKITEAPKKILKRLNRIRPIMQGMLNIEYAHYAIDPKTRQSTESSVSMAVKAAKKALKSAEMEASEIDLIIYAGIVYDVWCPPSSTLVQEELKIPYCAEISIHSNCTAIYKAIQVAADLIAYGRYENALVVTSQLSSAFLRAEYFNQQAITEEQAILRWFLCDGAGALVLTPKNTGNGRLKVTDTYLESVGLGIEPSMKMPIGAVNWNHHQIIEKGLHHLTQDLKAVAKLAPVLSTKGFYNMMEKTKLDLSSIKCFFLNIPTEHFMDLAAKILRKDLNNPQLPIYTKLSTRGYQGVPAIIIALDEYTKETQLNSGDRLVSFVTESSKWMHAGFILDYC
jgi:3-oxoacyl-[acyl-carrier-protein] synthase III